MQEYVTDAIVLKKEPLRDFDARYWFFTKKFGKLKGKATSARKITSKLAGHLEPGTLVKVRFVERNGANGNGAQIADALKVQALGLPLAGLHQLNSILPDGEPDAALWSELMGSARGAHGGLSWPRVLAVLGWDPQDAICEGCGAGRAGSAGRAREAGRKIAAFYIPKQ